MKTILLHVLMLLVCAVQLHAETSTLKQTPNIIFVLFDDLGYGQLKSYRAASEFKTPNLDRLAAEGMRFTDAHSAASVCTPTRYGILTGRYPSRIGQFGVLTTYSPPIIPQSRLTVASLLKQHGYDTACIGKWHLGMEWGGQPGNESRIPVGTELKQSPNAIGFDYFYGYTHARNIGTVIEQNKVVANVQEVETQPLLAQKVVEFLGNPARQTKPFFLYVPLCPPHTPIVPAAEFVGKSGLKDKASPYGDWMYQGDFVLGQLLQMLDQQKLADNTLIMVTSDNGAAGRSYAPLRESKGSIYEGGHRVPFLARWPGKIKAGSTCEDTICLNDLMATCAHIVGAKLTDNAGEDSVSILPDLLGTAKEPVREVTIHQSPGHQLAIRRGDWKLIFHPNGKRELYHLKTDLSETTNVIDENPAVLAQLTALMQKSIATGRSTPGMPQENESEISLEPAGGKKKDKKVR
jgi:arylsulfatase A